MIEKDCCPGAAWELGRGIIKHIFTTDCNKILYTYCDPRAIYYRLLYFAKFGQIFCRLNPAPRMILWTILSNFGEGTIGLSRFSSLPLFKKWFFPYNIILIQNSIFYSSLYYLFCVYGGFLGSRNSFLIFIFTYDHRQRAFHAYFNYFSSIFWEKLQVFR